LLAKYKTLSLRWDSNPQSLGVESFKQLRNTMRKENCQKCIKASSVDYASLSSVPNS